MADEFSNLWLGGFQFNEDSGNGDLRVFSASPIFDISTLTKDAPGDFHVDTLPGLGLVPESIVPVTAVGVTGGVGSPVAIGLTSPTDLDSGLPTQRLRIFCRARDFAGAPIVPLIYSFGLLLIQNAQPVTVINP